MAWGIGRLPWDPYWGNRAGASRHRYWRECRVHRRWVCRIEATWVRRVGGMCCSREDTWLP